MLRRFGLVFAVLALFSIAGGQWTVLQTVAWAGMLHSYTQRTGSFTVAVAQTFDGQHPCELCREIASAKAREHGDQPAVPGVKDAAKIKAMVAQAAILPPAPPAVLMARTAPAPPFGPGRTEQPPTPPPRIGSIAA